MVDTDYDTIFLVRAPDFKSAVDEVCINASKKDLRGHKPEAVFEIGADLATTPDGVTRILRGPYFQCAYNRGWKAWRRKLEGSVYTAEWEEEFRSDL